ncbi:unnamed protein product [Paramecium sonneborni]|uniref:WD40-repeat-containing domain n=1 Tax=Paramecium sonneborni TaxID=65129 RepID=A0A8S1NP53_9CILI|nr:unnamed protein product [Paramecium sonneborni]
MDIKKENQGKVEEYRQSLQQAVQKQDEHCYAIAINIDCSILVAGCDSYIKVFEFNQGILKQVQLLNEHKYSIFTLNFMKRSNKFISGSNDNSIIIWERNINDLWICQQKLTGHTSSVYCLILNNNEDVIASGSRDNSIRFWVKQNLWKCTQTITDHNSVVYGLSLNEQQNRVISCGEDKLILVIEQKEIKKKWQVIQKIQVDQFGFRICFIDNDIFTFQPYENEQMIIFEMNKTNQFYIKTKDIQVKGGSDYCLFPQQYIKQKSILVNKYASNLNLIKMKQNGEFIIEQSIEFKTSDLYGCISDDGQYLITWDHEQKEYQVRKHMEK